MHILHAGQSPVAVNDLRTRRAKCSLFLLLLLLLLRLLLLFTMAAAAAAAAAVSGMLEAAAVGSPGASHLPTPRQTKV